MIDPTVVREDVQPLRPRALVTGASRGCGRGCAIELARAGFDLVLTARTASEGEEREHSLRVGQSDTSPLPGSLAATAADVAKLGGTAWTVPVDLGSPERIASEVATASERWGPFRAVVHAARYVGPGHGDLFLATPQELLEAQVAVNVLGPLTLMRQLLADMHEAGFGVAVNITSGAAVSGPEAPVGKGGWSVGYGMTKAAFHRAIEVLAMEFDGTGVRLYNLEPGSVLSERMSAISALGNRPADALDPMDIGRVAAWLCQGSVAEVPPTGSHVRAREALPALASRENDGAATEDAE